MTKDLEFRKRLNELLEEDADDKEIIKLCLEQAWNQWPHSFHIWLNGKAGYGAFGGHMYRVMRNE